MEGNELKGLCLALLFVDTLLFGWPPYLLVRGGNQSSRSIHIRTTIISYLSCFGGGVFLGACLLHLLAEGREVMEEYFENANKTIVFPVYESVVAGGFFAIALVEQIAHNMLHNWRHQPSVGQPGVPSPAAAVTGYQGGSFTMTSRSEAQVEAGYDNHGYSKEITGHPQGQMVAGGMTPYHSGNASPHINGAEVVHKTHSSGSTQAVQETVIVYGSSLASSKSEFHSTGQHSHTLGSAHDHDDDVVEMIQAMEVNPLRAFLLLGALSFHTIFDGLAVGLQEGDTDIWEMFTAICIHKSLVAVCLGLQLFLAFKSRPIMGFVWVFVFSIISPIGVGIGMILSSGHINSLAESLINWILQGMATGTFLYVTIFEILRDEISLEKGGFLKIFVTILGFGCMAVAKYFDKD